MKDRRTVLDLAHPYAASVNTMTLCSLSDPRPFSGAAWSRGHIWTIRGRSVRRRSASALWSLDYYTAETCHIQQLHKSLYKNSAIMPATARVDGASFNILAGEKQSTFVFWPFCWNCVCRVWTNGSHKLSKHSLFNIIHYWTRGFIYQSVHATCSKCVRKKHQYVQENWFLITCTSHMF